MGAYIVLALACDGVVGGTQKRLKAALAHEHMKEKNFEMQFLTNFYMLLTAVAFTIAFDEFKPGYEFLVANPGIFNKLVMFSICSAVGQAFIFYLISSFDSLICTTVTTTRKVFSVLLSILTKGHNMNTQGWIGISAACLGILGELQQEAAESLSKKAGKSNAKSSGNSGKKEPGSGKKENKEQK